LARDKATKANVRRLTIVSFERAFEQFGFVIILLGPVVLVVEAHLRLLAEQQTKRLSYLSTLSLFKS